MEAFWYTKTSDEALEQLKVDAVSGLSSVEVEKRRSEVGKNELPRKHADPWWMVAGRQFASPLVYVLLVGAGISLYVKEAIDAAVILGAVLLNGVIGFIQEYRANRALETIQSAVVFEATVIREKKEHYIRVEDIVPGDILVLTAGDRVPADARLLTQSNLQTNESALTGESLPIEKKVPPVKKGTSVGDRSNMIYLGTTIVQGVCTAVVVETGTRTELGRIAQLIRDTREEDTPLQIQIRNLARLLAIVFVVLAGVLLLAGYLQGRDFTELLVTSIAVAVAAIPEGLLVAVTVILAVGMQRILKQNAIIKRLIAAETLGSVSIVCMDKTGTLTQAEMTPYQIVHEGGVTEDLNVPHKDDEIWRAAVLCNDGFFEEQEGTRVYQGNPTDVALLKGADKAGYPPEHLREHSERLFEIPFESENKFMAVLERTGKKQTIWVKGAPEVIIDRSSSISCTKKKRLTAAKCKKLLTQIETLTGEGYRLIAVAKKTARNKKVLSENDLDNLQLLGIIVLKDPLRPDAKGVVKRAVAAGVRPVLITGDHKGTAQAIMRELDLPADDKHTITGVELDELSDKDLTKKLKQLWIFARVEPRHKVRIVNAWKEKGEVVAMLGDGVNDAPSLKAADIGVALGSGTDVAKETSDIVLQGNNFKVMLDAIRQGRLIFQNIRNVTTYLLSDAFTELILIGGALIFHLPLPLLAGQILYINLIEDTFPALALAFEKGQKGLLQQKPRKRKEPILSGPIKLHVLLLSLVDDIILFAIFFWYLKEFQDPVFARTIVFAGLGIDSLFLVYSMRSLITPIWRMNPFSNRYLNIGFLVGIGMTVAAVYVPFLQTILKTKAIRPIDWLILILLAFVEIGIVEVVKYFLIVKRHPYGKRNK